MPKCFPRGLGTSFEYLYVKVDTLNIDDPTPIEQLENYVYIIPMSIIMVNHARI